MIQQSSLAITLAALAVSATAAPPEVLIDAANGNSHADVQHVLDAYPKNTTFRLVGEFAFGDHVHVEKSGTRLLGDWVDTNGNGRPDETDTWNTTIRIADGVPFIEGFKLLPRDEVNSTGYDVRNVEITGMHFSGVNVPLAAPPFPSGDQAGCRAEPLPYLLSNASFTDNWVEGGGIFVYREVRDMDISNNRFTQFQSQQILAHAVEMKGWTLSECGMPFGASWQGQSDLRIVDNVFTEGRDISVGFQHQITVAGNEFSGSEPGSFKLWMEVTDNARISDNRFEGGPGSYGILLWALSREGFVPTSDSTRRVDITGNAFVDVDMGVATVGGIDNSNIRNNSFALNGNPTPFEGSGIVLMDTMETYLGRPGLPSFVSSRPSRGVNISRNQIDGAGFAGVLLNGTTTGVTINDNSLSNPAALFGDVYLAPNDVVLGLPEADCPAHGNRVSGLDGDDIVTDGYDAVCPSTKPNTVRYR
uniref:Periplasmic copper-binding protein NosD beta helix domain-containing protein n=1 Tax=Haliea sp. ETY-M TaxID=1055105 RepID=A0A455R583_9GAMM|nr:hypothetical protein [Haliea sp. ETY-M]